MITSTTLRALMLVSGSLGFGLLVAAGDTYVGPTNTEVEAKSNENPIAKNRLMVITDQLLPLCTSTGIEQLEKDRILRSATQNNDGEVLSGYLQNGGDPNVVVRKNDGRTLLHAAIDSDSQMSVGLLLACRKVDINLIDQRQRTPFISFLMLLTQKDRAPRKSDLPIFLQFMKHKPHIDFGSLPDKYLYKFFQLLADASPHSLAAVNKATNGWLGEQSMIALRRLVHRYERCRDKSYDAEVEALAELIKIVMPIVKQLNTKEQPTPSNKQAEVKTSNGKIHSKL